MLHLGICDDLQGDRNLVEKLIKDYCMRDDYNFNVITFESGEALVNYYIDGKAPFDIGLSRYLYGWRKRAQNGRAHSKL